MKSTARLLAVLILLLLVDIGTRLVGPSQLANASTPTQYKVVEAPGRGADLAKFEKVLNDMASQGWDFDQWLYRGSSQAPDLIFHKR